MVTLADDRCQLWSTNSGGMMVRQYRAAAVRILGSFWGVSALASGGGGGALATIGVRSYTVGRKVRHSLSTQTTRSSRSTAGIGPSRRATSLNTRPTRPSR